VEGLLSGIFLKCIITSGSLQRKHPKSNYSAKVVETATLSFISEPSTMDKQYFKTHQIETIWLPFEGHLVIWRHLLSTSISHHALDPYLPFCPIPLTKIHKDIANISPFTEFQS
jgi:hypothetical protein